MLGGTDMQARLRKILFALIATLFILPGCLDFGGSGLGFGDSDEDVNRILRRWSDNN